MTAKIQVKEPPDQQRPIFAGMPLKWQDVVGLNIHTLAKSEAYSVPSGPGAKVNALRAQHRRPDSGLRSVDNGVLEDRSRGLTSLPALQFDRFGSAHERF